MDKLLIERSNETYINGEPITHQSSVADYDGDNLNIIINDNGDMTSLTLDDEIMPISDNIMQTLNTKSHQDTIEDKLSALLSNIKRQKKGRSTKRKKLKRKSPKDKSSPKRKTKKNSD